MELETIVAKTISELELELQDIELGLDLLSKGVDPHKQVDYHENILLESKLQLFLYLIGKVPITLKEGKKRVRYIHDLEFFRNTIYDFHRNPTSKVRDNRFYRLTMRITRQAYRYRGPHIEGLINELGSHPLVIRHFGRDITYDDVLSTNHVLLQYITGRRQITIQKSPRTRKKRIRTPEDLWALGTPIIKQGMDEHLYRLWLRVQADNRHGRGPLWAELIDQVGRNERVMHYLGRKVEYGGDVIRPTEEYDNQLLLRYLMGEIPVMTAEGKVVPKTLSDLCIFYIYEGGKITHLDKDFTNLYVRISSRRKQGRGESVEQLFYKIGRRPHVKDRYGKAITFRDVMLQKKLYNDVLELEALMLGEEEMEIGNTTKIISCISDMPFLRPDWTLASVKVKLIKQRIYNKAQETGVKFYDLVDRVGARPRVVEMYGRHITRFDVNPDFERYGRRAVPEPPTLVTA